MPQCENLFQCFTR